MKYRVHHKLIFFMVICSFVCLSACRSHRQASTSSASESTTVTFREVEKVVHLDGDTVKAVMQAVRAPFDTLRYSGSGASISAPVPELVEGGFVPQTQTIETKRTKVTVELTKTGEIKATAISKELDEKVTVQEKTITTSTSSVTVLEQKESWLKRTLKGAKRSFNTILTVALVVVFIYVFIRFKGRILNFLK